MRLRYRYLFIQALFFQSILSSAIIELPDLVRESNKVISVSFACNDLQFEKIGKKAFEMHGAYRLVPQKESDFNIQMAVLKDDSVGLRILNGSSVIYESKANLSDTYTSFLPLLDEVIEVTGSNEGI